MTFPMMLKRTFREWVTDALSPPYSQLLPEPYLRSFNQAGYATQLHRSLASIISEPTSQHFLQGKTPFALNQHAQEVHPSYGKKVLGGILYLYEK